jgi:hypothetical protein
MTTGTPASKARWNGSRSVDRSSGSGASTTSVVVWVSVVERPWPGKCFTVGVTPASASPAENARP